MIDYVVDLFLYGSIIPWMHPNILLLYFIHCVIVILGQTKKRVNFNECLFRLYDNEENSI